MHLRLILKVGGGRNHEMEPDWLCPLRGHPCPMAGGPHLSGGVFPSLLEYS